MGSMETTKDGSMISRQERIERGAKFDWRQQCEDFFDQVGSDVDSDYD